MSSRRIAVRFLPLLALAVFLPFVRDVTAPAARAAGAAVPGQYIVVLNDSADADQEAANATRSQGVAVDHVYKYALKGYAFRGSAAAAAAIARNPNVQFVSPDYVVEAVGKPGGDPAPAAETLPTGVKRIDAGKTAATVNVAVIDTGINLTHPDLNVAAIGKNCVRPNKTPNDDNGHGSHVSGTIGAKNNGSGVLGVAPGTTLYAVKVLNAVGSGTWSQVICGVDWVTANAGAPNNIKVANMSLGGGGSNDNNCGKTNNDALHKAICGSVAASVTYVVAAGNSASNLAGFVPAAYPEVLTVTAMSDSDGGPGGTGGAPTCRSGELDDKYATFSNYAGSDNGHTVAGPGVCIYSTWKSGGYNTISGTSMASPHVAGTVALCLSTGRPCAGMTPAQVIGKIRADASAQPSSYGFTGDPNSPSGSKYFGYLAYAGGY